MALARALMTGPEVLLLDEPTAALDPEIAENLMRTLQRLRESAGFTIVMVTHRLSEARSASTYAVMLEAGRVVEARPSARLFGAPVEVCTRQFVTAGEGGTTMAEPPVDIGSVQLASRPPSCWSRSHCLRRNARPRQGLAVGAAHAVIQLR